MILIFASFVVPICALAFGTASVGGDREDRTLVFLLVRPIPRALILLAKFTATLPLVLGLVVGSYWLYCQLAGEVGRVAFPLYLPAIVYMTLAYVCLFHLFAVWFRHSTILALVYALFMEVLLGSLPGIVKRVAVNYYGRSIMYAAGEQRGLAAARPALVRAVERGHGQLGAGRHCRGRLAVGAGGVFAARVSRSDVRRQRAGMKCTGKMPAPPHVPGVDSFHHVDGAHAVDERCQ